MNLFTLIYFLCFFIIIVIFVLILKKVRIQNLSIGTWLKIQYFPDYQRDFYLCTTDKLGFVLSSDDEFYKIHLRMTFRGSINTSFNNTQLFIAGLGWFVLRKPIFEDGNIRSQTKMKYQLEKDIVHEIFIEYEPKEGWEPFEFKQQTYKCLLMVRILDKKVKHRFNIQVREQNIAYIKELKKEKGKQAIPIEVPIIKN